MSEAITNAGTCKRCGGPTKGQNVLQPDGSPCTLAKCPPGLFLYEGHIGFETEYGGADIEVFNEAGECFWGGVTTRDERARLVVQPVEAVPTSRNLASDAIRLALKACEDLENSLVKNHFPIHPADIALMVKRKIVTAAKAAGIEVNE